MRNPYYSGTVLVSLKEGREMPGHGTNILHYQNVAFLRCQTQDFEIRFALELRV